MQAARMHSLAGEKFYFKLHQVTNIALKNRFIHLAIHCFGDSIIESTSCQHEAPQNTEWTEEEIHSVAPQLDLTCMHF